MTEWHFSQMAETAQMPNGMAPSFKTPFLRASCLSSLYLLSPTNSATNSAAN